jgi:hypothetical protein
MVAYHAERDRELNAQSCIIHVYILILEINSKKCDENRPICGLCSTKQRICEWRSGAENNARSETTRAMFQIAPESSITSASYTPRDSRGTVVVTKFPAAGTSSPLISPVDLDKRSARRKASSNSLMGITVLTSEEIEELDFSYNQELNGLQNTRRFLNNTERIKAATQKLSFNKNELNEIREEERLHTQKKFDKFLSSIEGIDISTLNEFCKVSKEFCLFDVRFNILLDIVLVRASTSPLLLRCLVALGEITIAESECIHILDEIQVICSTPDRMDDAIDLLSACLLLTRGIIFDVQCSNIWYQFLEMSKDIISRFNLLDKIEKIPDEARFLLSYFCRQDLHSSISYSNGTLLNSETYERILSSSHCDLYPPFDCLGPLLPYIAEVIELSKEAQSVYELLKDPKKISNWVYTEKFNTIIRKANKLDERIHLTHPSKNDLRTIKIEEFEIQLSLYELYQFSIQLNLRISVKKLPPVIPENQILLVKLFNLLRFLVHSSVRHSIYYALLISGVVCVLECDRKEILKLLNDFKGIVYSDSNIERIQAIIEESWVKNPGGLQCIDWFQIAEEFGWAMNLN